VLLGKIIKRTALGDDTPDKCMVVFRRTSLVRSLRIAEEHPSSSLSIRIKFNSGRIRELTAIVTEQYGEQFTESIRTKFQVKAVEDVNNRLGSVGVPDECEHKLWDRKVQGQQYFAAWPSNDRVHFNYRKVRMVLHELQEVLVSTAYMAFFVHLEPVLCLSASAHAYYSRHVDIPCCEDTLVHVIVECSFIEHDLISMVDAYMVKRLAFHEKRADNGIQSDRFFFSNLQSLAALRAQCLVFA